MKKFDLWFSIVIFLLIGLLIFLAATVLEDQYMILSFAFVFLAMVPFFVRFERKKLEGRELVLIALLASIAAVSRIPFAAIPSVQPTTFVIIVTALVFGAETGFIVGAVAALVSNLFLGQGPWTPWQMFAWGMIGLTAGMLKNTWFMNNLISRLSFGFIAGFLFGWIMNLWFILGLMESLNWKSFIAYFASSFFFDLVHAISNVILLALFSASWIKILTRFKRKYGLFST